MKALSVNLTRRSLALVAFETLLIVLAVALGAYIRLGNDASVLLQERGVEKALLIAFACQLCLYYADLYELRVASDRRELFIRIVQALSATSFLLAATYFWVPDVVIGRGVFMVSAVLVIVFVSGWRLLFEWLSRRVAPRERLLLVGTGPAAVNLAREIFDRRQELGEKRQRAAWLGIDTQPGCSAPHAIRRQRPDAEQGEYQDHFLEHRVECAVDEQDAGNGITEATLRQIFHR